MIAQLNSNNYLPLAQPYNAPPWNYAGTEAVPTIPNADVVDWVLVELRETAGDASTAYMDNTLATQAGFILTNGNIVSPDGTSPLQFTCTVTYKLYAVVYHRNHLAVLSKNELTNTAGNYSYDFTAGAEQVYGGANGHKEVAPGTWAMIAGDGDANGQVNNADKNDVWRPQSGGSGYKSGDFSMNGQVDNVDKNDLWKINSGKSSQVVGGWSCGMAIADTRDGQIYTTVQIGSQCWFKENLNIGTMIPDVNEQTNNGVAEKYCQENNAANCDSYGGLYQWNEVMQYSTTPGVKGLCPDGWHLPTDREWCELEQTVDTTITCESTGYRGIDGGTKLKQGGSSGFEALFGGWRAPGGSFGGFHSYGLFQTSSESSAGEEWVREVNINDPAISRGGGYKVDGFSVRCTKSALWQCGNLLLDSRDDKSYRTVQIGDQCWMAENLNIGTQIQGSSNQTNNGVIEKYCYDDNTANCDTDGGLYQWDEMMQYIALPGSQGICPAGWHVPADGEYCALTKFLDATVDCTINGWSGTDAGIKMKSTSGWYQQGNGTNSSGFNALPAGVRSLYIGFEFKDQVAKFWSSTDYSWSSTEYSPDAWDRNLSYVTDQIFRATYYKDYGFSVRCIKNTLEWSCGDPLSDPRDNQSYQTVQIGTQCWMAENLNLGTQIQSAGNQTDNGVVEKYCYDNTAANCEVYGGMYQWDEVMQYTGIPGAKGICPEGWHLPTDTDWCILEQFVDPTIVCDNVEWRGTDGGGKLKEAGTAHWASPNSGATNSSGFTALPGGHRTMENVFNNLTMDAHFWSSSENGSYAWYRGLRYDYTMVYRHSYPKLSGYSVRCVNNTVWVCGDTLIDARDNQTYNTVQIGNQCWMAENMNIGNMIPGSNDQTDNGTIEKYCYDNIAANCDGYGGLYQWNEMMQYGATPGVKGVCPDGWHLPTDAEYCTLTQFIDPTVNCGVSGWSGTDVGTKMKSTTGWNAGGNGTNASGFTALPGGLLNANANFYGLINYAYFWSSSEYGGCALSWSLLYSQLKIYHFNDSKYGGFSVRCVKD
jgi:uncharacterized protein (TIGR02145 family)